MKLSARGKSIRDGYGLIAPLMIGYLVFYVIPFMLVIYYSFSKGSVGLVGLANYRDMLDNKVFRLVFVDSVPACWLCVFSFSAFVMKKSSVVRKLWTSVYGLWHHVIENEEGTDTNGRMDFCPNVRNLGL